jgi:3-oxoadipate enol-lactonase
MALPRCAASAHDRAMPVLDTRHPKLHYRLDDHTDPWLKPATVLLQHGYARSSEFWRAWVPHLSGSFRILRPDMRGHGESPVDFDTAAPHTVEAYVDDVVALLDALGLDAVHYCGESFGGIVGMALAATHPDRVLTLTLVAAPVFQNAKSQDVYAAGFPTREEALHTLGTLKWAEKIYGAPGFFPDGTDPRLRDWYVAEIGKSDPNVLSGLYGTLLRYASAEPFLPRIAAPVLGLYPTSGLLTGSEQEALLARDIRHLTLVHLPTASHAILTLYPAECAGHLRDFLAKHERPSDADR